MSEHTGVLWIVGILGIILIMGLLKSRGEWILNFILRGMMGLLGIYFVNMLTVAALPGIGLGYNLLTFMISGILGIPGILLMYGVNFYMLL